jgi:hypothetical protein
LLSIDGDACGWYELHIEMAAKKFAEVLQLSLDYHVCKTDLELDNNTLERSQAFCKLPEKEKEHVYGFLDALLIE